MQLETLFITPNKIQYNIVKYCNFIPLNAMSNALNTMRNANKEKRTSYIMNYPLVHAQLCKQNKKQ